MTILLLQHHDIESAGILGTSLQNQGRQLDIRRPDRDGESALPTDLKDFEGVVVMGGPQNIDAAGLEQNPWLRAESDLIRAAHEAEMPVIGVCLGAQLVAQALGGTVSVMDKPEVGFTPVRVTTPGQVNAMMAGIAWESPQFQVHEFEISKLPASATQLASSDGCAHQAFMVGLRTYGFQFHFECDRSMIDAFHAQCGGLFEDAGLSREAFAAQMEAQFSMYERVGKRLCETITRLAFPYVSKRSA